MRASRMNLITHWTNVGASAAKCGIPVELARTGRDSIDAFIIEGYEQQRRRMKRVARREAAHV